MSYKKEKSVCVFGMGRGPWNKCSIVGKIGKRVVYTRLLQVYIKIYEYYSPEEYL